MQMINEIYNISIHNIDEKTGNPVQSKPIGSYFLENCRMLMSKYISEENIRKIAMMDPDDEDEMDLIQKEKNKIFNLIITICVLFDHRNDAAHIKLTSPNIYGLVSSLMNKYSEINVKMKALGNLYVGEECADPEEFECMYNMRTLYTEQIVAFMRIEYEAFMTDKSVITQKRQSGGKITIEENKLADLITRFKKDILPNITEPHIKSRCEEIFA
jgi:hypothetical protein